MRLEIAAVGEEAEPHRADPPGGQRALGGPRHAHGDVGVAAQQVLLPVGQRQLDGDLRIGFVEAGQDRRQHLDADDVAGGEPDHAAHRVGLAGGGAHQGLGRGGHGLGVGAQRQRRLGGRKAAGRAGEQRRAQRAPPAPRCAGRRWAG